MHERHPDAVVPTALNLLNGEVGRQRRKDLIAKIEGAFGWVLELVEFGGEAVEVVEGLWSFANFYTYRRFFKMGRYYNDSLRLGESGGPGGEGFAFGGVESEHRGAVGYEDGGHGG
jgi:hypothetical protein